MTSTVYMATNRFNGKRYIGMTGAKLARRRYEHEWHAFKGPRQQCPRFYAAMRKYGAEAFEWSTLQIYETFEDALIGEAEHIARLRPEYNLTAGGEGFRGYKKSQQAIENHRKSRAGWRPTEEQRRRQSEAQRGILRSEETKRKLSEINRNRVLSEEALASIRAAQSARKGWRHTAETRAKMSAARLGRPRPDWVMRKGAETKRLKRMAAEMSL